MMQYLKTIFLMTLTLGPYRYELIDLLKLGACIYARLSVGQKKTRD